MVDFYQLALDRFEYTRSMRRDLHQHPELGFKEVRTAGIVAQELSKLGLEVTTGVAETGVVAVLDGEKPGPVLLIRVDMDALPIQEQTGLSFASQNQGAMHACGHDGHVAVGLTAAQILAACRQDIRGTIKFVFQPAEEGMGGAERMLDAGIMEAPHVDYTLSLHLWNGIPVGTLGITTGAIMAGADIFNVVIEGRGGHGALPHETADPLVAAAHIISGLQTVVSRNVSPLDTAVLSVCNIKAGETFNVIPQMAEFGGTLRTYRREVRQKLVDRFETLVNGIASSMGCEAQVDVKQLTPAVVNDRQVTESIRKHVHDLFPNMLIDPDYRTMVSEDMAFMMEKAPGCYILVGSGSPEPGGSYGHHHPKFTIEEDALPIAAAVVSSAAMKLLS